MLLQQQQSELHAHQVTRTCSLQQGYVSQMHAYAAIAQPQDPAAVGHPFKDNYTFTRQQVIKTSPDSMMRTRNIQLTSHQSRKWQIGT